jgi:hypothetical protein
MNTSGYAFKFKHVGNESAFTSFNIATPPDSSIQVKVDQTADLSTLIDTFERFILACGFVLPEGAHLDFVGEEDSERLPIIEHPEE